MPDQDSDILAYSIPETARRTSLSIATVYRRVNDGTLRSIMVGKRRLIPADGLRDLLNGVSA